MERCRLVGANGAGKTTLLKTVSGFSEGKPVRSLLMESILKRHHLQIL